ncbi:MFS transporter [Streptosporangium sandarakinum]|uniref:MFS transporter n=1 Tax=Streptosporangium sandarakinum TaxID=1260955 RepID=UPI00379FC1DE
MEDEAERQRAEATYGSVLRLPGALRAFTAAVVGRLSYAMIPLALLFGVEEATDSFAAAGTTLGAFSIASLTAPVKSRFVDRYGQRKVLIPLACAYGVVVCLLALAVSQKTVSAVVYVVLGALVGICAPPLGPATRAVWAALTPTLDARQRAYSFDTVAEEVLFAIGPVVTGALIASVGAAVSMVVTGVLLLVGTVGLATSPAAQALGAERDVRRATWLGPFTSGGFVLVVVIVLGLGAGLGPIEVVVVARADAAGNPAAAGVLLAVLAVGSGLGGLLWGHIRHTRRLSTQLAGLLAVVAGATAVTGLVSGLIPLGVCLALTGVTIAPALIVTYLAVDTIVSDANRTEATTWVNTANNVGVAISAAAAGVIVEVASPGWALLAGAALLAALLIVLLGFRRVLDSEAVAVD